MEMIEISNVCKRYETKDYNETTSRNVVNHLDLNIEKNEFVCILGKSGCGKSTLINLMAGFLKPDEGKILINGKEVTKPSSDCGVVFQEHALYPWLTVEKNITFGLKINHKSRKEKREAVKKYVQMIGLEGYEKAFPTNLSGGMAQRVGIARALANEPKVLLMDEPFGALDAVTREKMRKEMISIWKQTSTSFIFVTHSVQEAIALANRVILLKDGEIFIEEKIDLEYPRDKSSEEFLRYVKIFEEGLLDDELTEANFISE